MKKFILIAALASASYLLCFLTAEKVGLNVTEYPGCTWIAISASILSGISQFYLKKSSIL